MWPSTSNIFNTNVASHLSSLTAMLRLAAITLLVVTLTCWLVGSHSAQAQEDPTPPSLSFQGDPLTLQVTEEQLKAENEQITPKVVVRNGSGKSVELKFSTVLRNSSEEALEKEINVEPTETTIVDPYSVTAVDLEMDAAQFKELSFPLKGFLVVSATKTDGSSAELPEVAPGTLSMTLNKVAPRPALLKKEYGPVDTRSAILIAPFLISTLVIGLSYFWFRYNQPRGRKYVRLIGKMSALGTGLNFDPTKSWGTLLAGVATLFNAFIAAQVFPETRATFTQKDIAVLSLSFGGLLFVSPAIYAAIRWRRPYVPTKVSQDDQKKLEQPKMPTSAEDAELQGFVLTLLATSVGILGALLGQLFLVVLLINEIENIDVTAMGRWLLWFLTGALMLYAILYVARGIISCLRAEARWGLRLREQRKALALDILTLRRQRRNLEQKPRRTSAEMEMVKSITKELEAKREKMSELKEQQKGGTYRRRLTTL
jgi:MFS family permease